MYNYGFVVSHSHSWTKADLILMLQLHFARIDVQHVPESAAESCRRFDRAGRLEAGMGAVGRNERTSWKVRLSYYELER